MDERINKSELGQLRAMRAQFGHESLCGDIPHQNILRKRASAEAADRGIESPAACFKRGANPLSRFCGPRMQMHADLDFVELLGDRRKHLANLVGGGKTHGIGQRNFADSAFGEQTRRPASTSSMLHASP